MDLETIKSLKDVPKGAMIVVANNLMPIVGDLILFEDERGYQIKVFENKNMPIPGIFVGVVVDIRPRKKRRTEIKIGSIPTII